ncbi:MAG: RES domain-containing protein [Saprospirales bacterium]|nr:MAG: RES domain-containing protein [Saprospirales bacterium]
MEVYRLVRKKYAFPLSGKGSAIKGGRWNSPGFELIYTAENRSLAMAEVAVHFSLGTIPSDYLMLTIFVPDEVAYSKIFDSDLADGWKDFPHPTFTQRIGDKFIIEGANCLLFTPSAITQGDYNVLINPNHKDFSKVLVIKSEPFPINKRIFKIK